MSEGNDERGLGGPFELEAEAEERLLRDGQPFLGEDALEASDEPGPEPPADLDLHDHGEPGSWVEGDEKDEGAA